MSPIEKAIDTKIVTDTGCWIRPTVTTKNGYSLIGGGKRGMSIYSHRASYVYHKGDIPSGIEIDHLCRNRACFNPDHLEAVTRSENTRRGIMADSRREWHLTNTTHCKQGHEYTMENTYFRPTGGRACKQCRSIRTTEYRFRQAELRRVAD